MPICFRQADVSAIYDIYNYNSFFSRLAAIIIFTIRLAVFPFEGQIHVYWRLLGGKKKQGPNTSSRFQSGFDLAIRQCLEYPIFVPSWSLPLTNFTDLPILSSAGPISTPTWFVSAKSYMKNTIAMWNRSFFIFNSSPGLSFILLPTFRPRQKQKDRFTGVNNPPATSVTLLHHENRPTLIESIATPSPLISSML